MSKRETWAGSSPKTTCWQGHVQMLNIQGHRIASTNVLRMVRTQEAHTPTLRKENSTLLVSAGTRGTQLEKTSGRAFSDWPALHPLRS